MIYKTKLTVALSCWSLYLGSMLSRKWASAVSTNFVLAISLSRDIAVLMSYSFLFSLSFWISKNLLDLLWHNTQQIEFRHQSWNKDMGKYRENEAKAYTSTHINIPKSPPQP